MIAAPKPAVGGIEDDPGPRARADAPSSGGFAATFCREAGEGTGRQAGVKFRQVLSSLGDGIAFTSSMACGASRATLAIGEPSSPGGASRRLRFIRAPAPRSGGRPGRVGALGSRIASFGALRLAVETTKEWDSMYSVKQKEIPAFGGVGAFQRSPCAQPCRSVGGRSASEVDIEAKAVGPIDAVCGDCWSR